MSEVAEAEGAVPPPNPTTHAADIDRAARPVESGREAAAPERCTDTADIDRVAAHGKPLFPLPPPLDRTIAAPARPVPSEAPVCVDTGSRIVVLDRNRDNYTELLDRAASKRRRKAGGSA